MKVARWATLSCLIILSVMLAGCGGGGGGETTADDPDPGPGPTPPGPTGLPLGLHLAQGDYFDFVWTTESTSFAQPDQYDSEVDSGQFRITLGAPITLSGSTAYPLHLSGEVGAFGPRWTHVAVAQDGSLLGATGGTGLTVIYSAASRTWTGGGFFVAFASSETVNAATGSFDGNYNQMSSLVVSHEVSSGGCETILGETICDDEETTFSEKEHFKAGVGPIGYAMRASYTSGGGGFYTSHQDRRTVELIATSETPTDGSVFKPPPWEAVASLPQARHQHAAAVLGGEIYVIGGLGAASSSPLTSVVIYNPISDSWRTSAHTTPQFLYAPQAVTLGGLIYVISRQSGGADLVYVLNPTTGWATGAGAPFDDPAFSACAYDHPVLGDLALVMTPDGAFSGQLKLFAYRPADNIWYTGDAPLSSVDHRWFATSMIGDTLYLSGGWRQSLSNKLYDRALRQDMADEVWLPTTAAMTEGRYDHASAVLDGELFVLGGRPGPSGPTHRSVESYSPGLDQWVEEVPMFGARREFAVVELGGSLYAIGGHDGNDALRTVEKFTPQD